MNSNIFDDNLRVTKDTTVMRRKYILYILMLFLYQNAFSFDKEKELNKLRQQLVDLQKDEDRVEKLQLFFKEKVSDLDKQSATAILEELFLFKEIQSNDILTLEVGNYVATYYSRIGQSDACLDMYFKLLPLTKGQKQKEYYSIINTGIGHEYFYLGKFDEAMKHFKASHDNNLRFRDSSSIAGTFINIGITFSRLDQEDSALAYINEGLYYYEALKDTLKIATTLNNLGSVYHRKLGRTEEALAIFNRALELFAAVDNRYQEGITTMNVGVVLYELGQSEEALLHLKQALNNGKELNNIPLYKLSLKNLYEMYAELNQFDSAYHYQATYYQLNDSLNLAQQKSIIKELEEQYATNQLIKENEIAQLRISVLSKWIVISLLAIVSVILITLVIIRKKRMKEEIAEMKSKFYAYITHEFKTPLSLIKAPAQQIKRNAEDSQTMHRADLIIKSADELLSLFNQMLDISKLESNEYKLNSSVNDIMLHVKAQLELFEPLSSQKNITISVLSDLDKMEMEYDKGVFQKAFQNLLTNAIKFTPENGNIIVEVVTEEMNNCLNLCVSVKDSGEGFNKNALANLFQRYKSNDGSTVQQGTGLGLALSKELMVLMGGDLVLMNTSVKGSEFRLSIPIKNTELSKPFIEDHEDFRKLLIVDDNEDILQFLNQELSPFFKCTLARDGEDAFRIAKEIMPDIIISDVMMPKVTGLELAKKLKEELLTDHIPILLLSAKTSPEQKSKGLKSGAISYLTKPFDLEELKQTLFNYLSWMDSLKVKYSANKTMFARDESDLRNHQNTFIKKSVEIIENHIESSEFGVHDLAEKLFLSRTQVHRKIKATTGLSTSAFIRNIRLEFAKDLIHNNLELNVSEVAYRCGFSSLSYFSTCYTDYFGTKPSSRVDQ